MTRFLVCLAASALIFLLVSPATAADDTGLAGEPKEAPRAAVNAFLKDLAAGKYDKAYARTTPAYQKAHPKEKWKLGFTKMAGVVDLAKLKLDQMFASEAAPAREARAAGVTGLLDAGAKNRKLGLGFGLVRQKDQWLIRDIDVLPNGNAVKNFIDGFRKAEPKAVEIPAGAEDQPPPVPRENAHTPSLP